MHPSKDDVKMESVEIVESMDTMVDTLHNDDETVYITNIQDNEQQLVRIVFGHGTDQDDGDEDDEVEKVETIDTNNSDEYSIVQTSIEDQDHLDQPQADPQPDECQTVEVDHSEEQTVEEQVIAMMTEKSIERITAENQFILITEGGGQVVVTQTEQMDSIDNEEGQTMTTEFEVVSDGEVSVGDVSADPTQDEKQSPNQKIVIYKTTSKPSPRKSQASPSRNSSPLKSSSPDRTLEEDQPVYSGRPFMCEVCRMEIDGQVDFFLHLKSHYETPKRKKRKTRTKSEHQDEETQINRPEIVHRKTKSGRISKPPNYDPDMINLYPLIKLEAKLEPEDSSEEKDETKKSKMSKSLEKKPRKNQSKAKRVECEDGTVKFECDTCKKLFANPTSLATHTLIHKGEKPCKCEDCGRGFRQYSDLMYHRNSIHLRLKPYQCEYCGKEFSRKYSLTIHRKVHTGIRDYKCDVCNKGFRAAIYLQEHRRIHSGEKPYLCDVCGLGFRLKHVMQRHRTNIHFKASKDAVLNKNPDLLEDDLDEIGDGDESLDVGEVTHEGEDGTHYVTVVTKDEKDEEVISDGNERTHHRLVFISENEAILV